MRSVSRQSMPQARLDRSRCLNRCATTKGKSCGDRRSQIGFCEIVVVAEPEEVADKHGQRLVGRNDVGTPLGVKRLPEPHQITSEPTQAKSRPISRLLRWGATGCPRVK